MNTDRKLGEVAANLDDISDTIEELQDAAQEEGAKPRAATLDELKQDVEDASEAIDDVVDPEQPRKA
jgi:methyl-accepting chemotaxis protein